MSSLLAQFRDTRSKYGTVYALVRLRNFLLGASKLLLHRRGILAHNAATGETDGRPRGNRIIVVGNGPSLNKLPMHLLEGEDVFVSNNFHLMFPRVAWRPRYLAMSDAYVLIESHAKTVEHAAVYERIYVPAVHASNVDAFRLYDPLKNAYFFNVMPVPKIDGLAHVPIHKTVTNFMLGIAGRLGYRDVLFIGMDLSYPSVKHYDQTKRVIQSQRDDPDHFSPEYFNKGKHFHAPEADEMRNQIRQTITRMPGTRFRNIGVGGRLDFIERDTLRHALGIDRETEIARLRRHLLYRLPLVRPEADAAALTEALLTRLGAIPGAADEPADSILAGLSVQPTGGEADSSGEIVAIDALGYDIRTTAP